ncbi:unnamed protein product [Paramecium octaurelia]|uniref:Uncharacterized protein n=1 Tax=Paramecium octaurelia TaxID=43137 RepID=A0A8S1XD69_PAROT|nr:unnamed protein product [Paramecium octaurelia]
MWKKSNSIIIAFIYLINQIPCFNLVLSIPVMILYLQFIWIQNDETIFKKCLKTLTLFFVIWLGMLPETQILRYLIDLVSDLIKMFSIIKIKTKEVVIIGGCTIVVFIGGAALASQPLAIPLIAASCNQVAIKSCVLIITGLLSRGEPAAISSGAFLLELGSNSAKAVVNCVSDAVVTTSISVQRKAISKICSMNVALGIGVLVALAAGLEICKWLRQKKSE